MRISSNTIFASGVARLADLQSNIVKTQQQISTGHRILSPSDDPTGSARALDLSQSQSINTQFGTNRQAASNSLTIEESTLQGTTSLLQDVKTLAISAGDAAYSDADRLSIATDLRGRLDELLSQANATDGTGNYIFAGFQVTAPPFSSAATGAQYSGDQGQRLAQVGTSRQIAVSDTGNAVFQNIRNSGAQVTAAAAGSTGSVSALSANGSATPTGHDYDIRFTSTTQFDIFDVTANAAVATGQTYTAGQPISFDGVQLTVSGTPSASDRFTVRTPAHQSVFTTISDLITALETPLSGVAGKAAFSKALSLANGNLDNALDNVLTVRASIGSRLKEIDSLNTSGEDRNFQLTSVLSQIQDVDYTKAISDFTQQNTNLEAAQKTFVKVSGLSLFSLI